MRYRHGLQLTASLAFLFVGCAQAKEQLPLFAIRDVDVFYDVKRPYRSWASMYNPCIGGWINYYGQFYRAVEIDSAAYRWLPSPLGAPEVQAPARTTQRHTRLVGSGSPCQSKPLCSLAVRECRRPNTGSRVYREVHARF